MAKLPSLPDVPHLADVFRAFPHGVRPLLELHDALLRGESPFTVGERELIAAYVSGLNGCDFCAGSHRIIAEVHGVEPEVLEGLLADPAAAGVAPKLLPVLAYARKLTLTPSRVADADAEAVYAAGWDERALYDAVAVCALFNYMNRIVEGTGVVTNEAVQAATRERHLANAGDERERRDTYTAFGREIGVLEG